MSCHDCSCCTELTLLMLDVDPPWLETVHLLQRNAAGALNADTA